MYDCSCYPTSIAFVSLRVVANLIVLVHLGFWKFLKYVGELVLA